MGLRRLRGRLDQLQGNANFTLAEAQALIADLQDGFGLKIVVDAGKIRPLLNQLLVGNSEGPVELPLTIKIDPTIDTVKK